MKLCLNSSQSLKDLAFFSVDMYFRANVIFMEDQSWQHIVSYLGEFSVHLGKNKNSICHLKKV